MTSGTSNSETSSQRKTSFRIENYRWCLEGKKEGKSMG